MLKISFSLFFCLSLVAAATISATRCGGKSLRVFFLSQSNSRHLHASSSSIARSLNDHHPSSLFGSGTYYKTGNFCYMRGTRDKDIDHHLARKLFLGIVKPDVSVFSSVASAIERQEKSTEAHMRQHSKLIVLLTDYENDFLRQHRRIWTKDSSMECMSTKSPTVEALENYLIESNTFLFVLTEKEEVKRAWDEYRFSHNVKVAKYEAGYNPTQIQSLVEQIDDLLCSAFMTTTPPPITTPMTTTPPSIATTPPSIATTPPSIAATTPAMGKNASSLTLCKASSCGGKADLCQKTEIKTPCIEKGCDKSPSIKIQVEIK